MSRIDPRPFSTAIRSVARSLVVPLLLGGAGCSGAEGPTWIRLAEIGDATLEVAITSSEEAEEGRVRSSGDEEGRWFTVEIEREDWEPHFLPAIWTAPGLHPRGSPTTESAPFRLTAPGRDFESIPVTIARRDPTAQRPGSFCIVGGNVMLQLAPGEEPPPRTLLTIHARRERNGRGVSRVNGRRFSTEAFAVWPGERLTRTVNIPASSALRFAVGVEPLRPRGAADPVRFQVRLEGEILFETELGSDDRGNEVWHEVPLPHAGVDDAQLEFSVEGPLAHAFFAAPVIGPLEVGDYAARPWPRPRPDLVLFSVDTLRADSVGRAGGESTRTPFLDELARGGLSFTNARSTSTYTLPAHASMLTGRFPMQAGISHLSHYVNQDLETLAGILEEAGYRTGAVVGAGMLSRAFGFDSGFEWFDEVWDDLPGTRERVASFLDADDGRPVFLFIHSYEVHSPYLVSEATRQRYGGELGIEGNFDEWNDRLSAARRVPPEERDPAQMAEIGARLRALYLGGICDFDRDLRGLHADLATRGLLDEGYFLLTSDHGEAFWEHEAFWHTGEVFEELTRIPLLLLGPDLEPSTIEAPVSIVDVPRTFGDLAGIEIPEAWVGRSLLTPDPERPVFLFECLTRHESSSLAVIEGNHKVFASERAEELRRSGPTQAFDLSTDPRERHDEVSGENSWPAELLDRHRARLLRALESPAEPKPARHLGTVEEDLRRLGYFGD